jgi:hypothetical protein
MFGCIIMHAFKTYLILQRQGKSCIVVKICVLPSSKNVVILTVPAGGFTVTKSWFLVVTALPVNISDVTCFAWPFQSNISLIVAPDLKSTA